MTDNKPVKKEESYDISHLEQTELKLEKTKGISFYYKIKMQAIKGKTELNLLKSQAEAGRKVCPPQSRA